MSIYAIQSMEIGKGLCLSYFFINLLVNILKDIENHLIDTAIGMCNKVVFDGSYSNFGGQLVWKTKFAR